MMNFSFENQGTNTYLVYKISDEDDLDSMSLGMLTNNKITGLAPVIFTQMDESKFIKYNITAHVSVEQFFSGPVNKKRLIGVFSGIVDAMLSAEDYMIDENTIIIDEKYIFADVSSCETELICLPVLNKNTTATNANEFFKKIMFSTQFDQTENCDYVAKIMNFLNSNGIVSLRDFKKLLAEIGAPIAKQYSENKPQQATPPAVNSNLVQNPIQQNPKSTVPTQPKEPGVAPKSVEKASIPAMNSVAQPRVVQNEHPKTNNETRNQKNVSLFDLLMHYSKENAAAYKAQKEAKKQKSVTEKSTPAQKAQNAQVHSQQPQTERSFAFAVPGQGVSPINQNQQQAVQQQAGRQNTQPSKSVPPTSVQQIQPSQMPAPPVNNVQQHSITNTPSDQTFIPPQPTKVASANFGETTVLGAGTIGETTVLTATQNPNKMTAPHLIRKKNNEKISVNKPVFRVGKERSYVDYFIGDNTAISRSHANIITREGKYFVVDTNSTNHTYINGVMLQSNAETPLSHGDSIRFANEDFEFKIY